MTLFLFAASSHLLTHIWPLHRNMQMLELFVRTSISVSPISYVLRNERRSLIVAGGAPKHAIITAMSRLRWTLNISWARQTSKIHTSYQVHIFIYYRYLVLLLCIALPFMSTLLEEQTGTLGGERRRQVLYYVTSNRWRHFKEGNVLFHFQTPNNIYWFCRVCHTATKSVHMSKLPRDYVCLMSEVKHFLPICLTNLWVLMPGGGHVCVCIWLFCIAFDVPRLRLTFLLSRSHMQTDVFIS